MNSKLLISTRSHSSPILFDMSPLVFGTFAKVSQNLPPYTGWDLTPDDPEITESNQSQNKKQAELHGKFQL